MWGVYMKQVFKINKHCKAKKVNWKEDSKLSIYREWPRN